jgi:hypothetical protein
LNNIPLWIKPTVPVWLEDIDEKTKEVKDFLKAFIVNVEGMKVRIDITSTQQ